MRSRYSAYAMHKIEYLTNTLHPSRRAGHDERETKEWSYGAEWLGLQVLATGEGNAEDSHGTVEFVARYRQKGEEVQHHELAEFRKKDGVWYFYDGKVRGGPQVRREAPKVGRNDPCSCGSGKKFKKCCGKGAEADSP